MTQSISTPIQVQPFVQEEGNAQPMVAQPQQQPSYLSQLGKKILAFSVVESLGMGANYLSGYTISWALGMKNPSGQGALSALSLPAGQVYNPAFRKLLRCTPETTVRTTVANQIAGIFTTATAAMGAHKLGFSINPQEVVKFKMTGMYLSAILKMINSPADKMYTHIPELVSGVGLSALFCAAVSNGDWINNEIFTRFGVELPQWSMQINYGELFYQQAYMIGIIALVTQASRTIETLTRDDTPQEPVPVAASA